ncbi:hypothetical protein GGI23_002006 [Coemansia sp. RSA 2559]|nr:hypothetical protein GGI23_002006 [Coemansia sp. RSA 2559]KAJ2864100.1 hypothetical protein GGI22_001801 [Coemansia erecta]
MEETHVHPELGADYAEFLAADFDPLQYARRISRGDNDSHKDSSKDADNDQMARAMEALGKRADALDGLLQQTVIASHADLLKQVVGVKALDASLAQVEDNVREIKAYMHALRTRIRVPYQQSQVYTSQASNLHAAIRHVRATARFIQLVRRLQTQIPLGTASGTPDFALGALTLLDIERAVTGGDLEGIHIVDQGMETIVKPRRDRTIAQAEQMLESGIRLRNQGDIAGGLQILFNLGILATAVAARVRQYVSGWESTVHGRLDPRDVSAYVRDHNARAKSIDGSDMVGITGVVLSRIEGLVDDLLARGLELRVLERVLARKRDVLPRFDVSNFSSSLAADVGSGSGGGGGGGGGGGATPSFLDLVARELNNSSNTGIRVVAFWWREALSLLAAEINSACTESSVIRQMLTNSYPRVVQLFVPKLEQLQPLDLPLLWDQLLGKFEAEYVSRAASRIEDAVARCYPPPPPPGLMEAQERRSLAAATGGMAATGSELITAVSVVPNRKLVAGVIRSMSTELEMAKSDARLSAAVTGAASSAARTFASVTETKIATVTVNPSVLNPFGVPPHPLTKSLVGLLNTADALRLGIEELGSRGFSVDGASLRALVDKHAANLLDIADRAVTEAIYQAGASADSSSSLPSLDLFAIAAQWLQTQVLEPMNIASFHWRVIEMVTKYLKMYTRVVCLAFPLTEETKLLLTGHATQFEFACSQLMAAASKMSPGDKQAKALSGLGGPYRALRMLRPLLFMNTAELARLVDEAKPGSDTPMLDLADHIVCRVATALLDSGVCSSAEVRPFLPYRIHQCKWTDWASSPGSDIQLHQRNSVLAEALQHLADKIQKAHKDSAPAELVSLAQAARGKLLSS